MTNEEKARAYDEALEKARKRVTIEPQDHTDAILKDIFPQLAESEDEKMLREIKRYIKEQGAKPTGLPNGIVSVSDMIAWLEKRKEQFEEPKIAFGDWGDEEKKEAIITCLKYMRFVKKITNQEYDDLVKWLDNTVSNVSEKEECLREVEQEEQKPVEKHDLVAQLREHFANTPKEQLEAEWKELEHWNNIGPTVEEYFNRIMPAEWSEEDKKTIDDAYCWLCEYAGSLIQRNYGKSSMLYGIANKLKSLYSQPKQEWSEEDEETLACAISVFEDFAECKNVSVPPASAKRYLKRLKSLHPHLKQEWSKEDEANRTFILESLEDQIRFCKKDAKGAYYIKQIRTAQNWLKSLSLNLKKKNEDVAKLCSNE